MGSGENIEIGIVQYPGVQQAAVLGLTDLFEIAGQIGGERNQGSKTLVVSHWSLESENHLPVRAGAHGACDDEAVLAALILPPSLAVPITRQQAAPFVPWLCREHQAGVILASVCAGAFLLAETGLLAERPVTTHWKYADVFKERFPQAELNVDRLLIDEADIVTAGGLMAWTDLGLQLVARFLGPAVMVETARVLLIDTPGREQRYYTVFTPNLRHHDKAILKVQHWLQQTGGKDTTLAVLAEKAGLESRTFLRRFQKATGMTSSEYCQRLRVSRAQELLANSALPIDQIGWEVGYSDTGAFRKVFTRIVGLKPGDYRRRFRATAYSG